jgi:hypothetical protein
MREDGKKCPQCHYKTGYPSNVGEEETLFECTTCGLLWVERNRNAETGEGGCKGALYALGVLIGGIVFLVNFCKEVFTN